MNDKQTIKQKIFLDYKQNKLSSKRDHQLNNSSSSAQQEKSVSKQQIPSTSGQQKTNFSIEHILTKAGTTNNQIQHQNAFSWLHCTRYCPPKLPRPQKIIQKRQLGRHPRIPFSSQQLSTLEEQFKKSPYLCSSEVIHLSQLLGLTECRVKIWFQNRRARERREQKGKCTNLEHNICYKR